MKLTCVTATYNVLASGNHDRLVRCLESVAALRTEHEHLIFDGASTDGTVEILRELESKIPGVRVVSEPDSGIYDALNKGLRDARGDWFYVLGCDDHLCCPDLMDRLLEEADRQEASVILSTVVRDGNELYFQSMRDLQGLMVYHCHSHQGVVLRSDIARACGGFDSKNPICADFDMMLKVHKKALKTMYSFEPFAYFAKGGMSSDDSVNVRFDREVVCRHFRLKPTDFDNRNNGYPVHVLIPYLFHADAGLRISSRALLRQRIRYWAKRLFRR